MIDGASDSNNLGEIIQISAGLTHTCALTLGGEIKCWGYAYLGNGSRSSSYPVSVMNRKGSGNTLSNIVQISAGSFHTCGLTSMGNVKCWGRGYYGSLGNGRDEAKDYPISVISNSNRRDMLGGIVQVAVGDSHTCVLTGEGKVKCWGQGRSGKLGDGGREKSFLSCISY